MTMQWSRLGMAALGAMLLLPAVARAQQPTKRRQAPIEIRGQVPTPQVVTVRPREVPTYNRQVLVPRFYDHDFWPDIETGYLMVPQRQITGQTLADSLTRATLDTTQRGGANGASAPAPGAARPSTAPPAAPSATPADTTRRPTGTASAPPSR